MRRFKRLAAAIVLVALPSAALADEVDDIVRQQTSVSRLPGVAVVVIERGRPLLARTYGTANLEWNAPITPGTRFVRVSGRQLTATVLTNQQMFHPVLAEAILDLYLPEAVDAPAMPDRAPQVAARVRAILSGQAGADDAALAAPLKTSPGQALLRSVGKVGDIELLSIRRLATCRTERVYRVRFALRPMTWTALAGCRDELLDLRPAP